MKSKTYAICWNGSLHNCLEVDKQLSGSGIDYLFYNVSDREVDSPNWIKAEDVRYYGHFHNALKDFQESKYDIFIFHAGDPVYDDYVGYTKYIEELFENDNKIGLFAPSFDYDTFTGHGSFIAESKKYENLYLSSMTNGIYLAMDWQTALFTLGFMDWAVKEKEVDFSKMVSGWGLDLVYNAYVIYENKKIYRDKLVWHHPRGSSYEEETAKREIETIVELFLYYTQSLGLDALAFQKILDLVVKKARGQQGFELKASEFYVNALKDLEI